MSWLRRVRSRDVVDRDLDRELRFHLEERIETLVAHGVRREEAYRRARAELGGLDSVKEQCRDVWRLRWLDDLRSDLRFGLRALARNPGFTVTAALTLSIGIGATAAMFSVFNAMLFRPFPAPDPEQLVVVAQRDEHTTIPHFLSYPEYLDYRDRNQVFEGLAAHHLAREFLSTGGAAEPAWVWYVSRDYFEVLRVDAARGRTFLPEEGRQPGDAEVVVLSHATWQRRFAGDPSVVGQVVQLGRGAYTVIGVTPESFAVGGIPTPDLFVPATQAGLVSPLWSDTLTNRSRERFSLIGRLAPGVTVAEARAQLNVLTTTLATEYPDSMEHSELWVVSERRARPMPQLSTYMPLITITMMALAFLVLAIACANVATLLIGRGIARRREMSLRAGLGATWSRLVRQLATENVLLALLGGAGGALAALWTTDLLSAVELPILGVVNTLDVRMDWRVFAFTAMTATLTGLTAGLVPVLRTTRAGRASAIAGSGRTASQRATGQRLTSGLLVAQVAISLVLLVCAGLFVRSAQNFATLDVGFRTDEVLLVSVDPLPSGDAERPPRMFYRGIADEVEALPGIRAVSWARYAPQEDFATPLRVVTLDGGAIPETDPAPLQRNWVDPAFFDTLGLVVLRGRGFRDEDATDDRPVAMLNETAARQLWPGQDPLGKRFFGATAPERQYQVIGVVPDARLSQDISRVPAFVFFPLGERLFGPATLHVHTEGPPTALASAVTDAIRRRDPALVIFRVTSMDTHVKDNAQMTVFRLSAMVTGALSALGLLLAAVGLYGMVAYSVTQRMQEFAIRTALGAPSASIVWLAVGRGMALLVGGLALGLLAASAITPFMAGVLVNVNPRDPVVFGVTGLVLVGVALLACLAPSRRAAKADPLAALNVD